MTHRVPIRIFCWQLCGPTAPPVVSACCTARVSFEGVVKGETSVFVLKVRNDGAIPTKYAIMDPIAALGVNPSRPTSRTFVCVSVSMSMG
jgi:hypothetical protein